MSTDNYLREKIANTLSSRIFWLFMLFAFTLTSCKKKETGDNSDYSDAFNLIYHNNRIYDVKKAAQGMHYLDSAFSRLNKPTVNDTFRFYAMHFMYQRKMVHNPVKELLYADSMIAVAGRCVNEKQYVPFFSEANFAKGDAYFDAHQYNDAYRCFYEGYILGKNYLNYEVLAEYTYRMGMITFRQSHFKLAANYFKESYKQSPTRDDFATFYQKQELLNDIGESYQHDGELDSADMYFNIALDYINKNSDKFKSKANMLEVARAVVYGDQGAIAYSKGQYGQAADLLKKSTAINLKKYNDNYNAEQVEITLAQLYLERHEDALFVNLMQDMRGQLNSIVNKDAEADWNRLMSNYYTEKGNFAGALQYFKNYSSLKDSLVQQSLSLRETDVGGQLANYDKQYQIEHLRNDNKLQLIYLYLAIICAIMAVIIIFLVYRNWKRSKDEVLVISDLNKQINLQKKDLEATLNELKLSSQEKDRILRTVAHDLRNPLGGVASLTSLMAEESEYTDEQKELINLIKNTLNNSMGLINEILEATDDTPAKINAEKEPVEINALLGNCIELLRFKATEKEQQIILETLETPIDLFISREKIWRVMSNLISNAMKFSPERSTIKVKLTDGANSVKISVTDNGIGIPNELKNKVFNMFTDAKRPGTAGEKSFGLGLSICQQIIENHKGKIWFESDTKKGTTFYISLSKPGK